MLILNKKSISNHENQLFQAELEKFRPYQNRLLQANHKQTALMKELTKTYGDLLQDKRVRSEQAKYEGFTRQRNAVLTRYKKVFQAFNDLIAGLLTAESFYSEMKDSVESLEKNVETFVNNRRSEGAQLLSQIERDKASNAGGQADKERDRLRELMERMSVDPSSSSLPTRSKSSSSRPAPLSRPSQSHSQQPQQQQSTPYPTKSPPISPPYTSTGLQSPDIASVYSNGYPQYSVLSNGNYALPPGRDLYQSGGAAGPNDPYNPMAYPYQAPGSPPPNQQFYPQNSAVPAYPQYPPQHNQYMPHGYIPPPPPPGPPPGSQQTFSNPSTPYPAGPGGYAQHPTLRQSGSSQQHGQNDPWAGLNAWK